MKHMPHTVIVASAALLSTLSGPAHSSIFDRDDRQYVPIGQGSIYSPVGLVKHAGLFLNHYATGFVVDDCHVLTTQSAMGYGAPPLGERMKFQLGIGTRQHQVTRATVVAAGGVEKPRTGQEQSEAAARDWLLLRLDKCLGARAGHVALSTGGYSPYEFRDLRTAGYPMGRSKRKGLTVDPSCTVISARGTAWLNDCAVVRGDAGDPIFRISASAAKPQMIVYAMQAYGFPGSEPISRKSGYENVAVPMALVAPQIQPYLSVDLSKQVAAR